MKTEPQYIITYNIRSEGENYFYENLKAFANNQITFFHESVYDLVTDYEDFLTVNNIETFRSREEYYFELLMLGVYWNQYKYQSVRYLSVFHPVLKFLYTIRSLSEKIKPHADRLRGYLSTIWLVGEQKHHPALCMINIAKVIRWMECTNEYTEEVKRMNNWVKFLEKLPEKESEGLLRRIVDRATCFEKDAAAALGEYTRGVSDFLKHHHDRYKFKENYFFTRRSEAEYHLNMTGAAILNQALKPDFKKTLHQTVLLPSCMCFSDKCKAVSKGKDILCTHCTSECTVSRLTCQLKKHGIKVVIIPHSSRFTDWLKPWANQYKEGLVGVACVLNLLKGGYEMKNLNIPSQCVFLDYCGCKKHWHSKGLPTQVDENQLNTILNTVSEKIEVESQVY